MKILVPVDGSKYTGICLKAVSFLCKGKEADVYVMTAIPHLSDIDLELTPSDRETMQDSFEKRGEEILEKSKKELESYGIHKITTVLDKGESISREIIDFAEKEKFNLIVIGIKGLSDQPRFLVGSVTEKVVKHSPCCVFVVKEECSDFLAM
jgi:nucleotide-binding universal stress UspA family protein